MNGLKKYLNKYGFVSSSLSNIPLQSFQYLFQILFNQIESRESLLFSSALNREQKMTKILAVLSESYESTTLYLIIKQMAVLFMLARKYKQKGKLNQPLLIFLQQRIKIIIEEDTKKIIEGKQKKSSSLGRLYQYIRVLSGSKEKNKDTKTKIQVSSLKGVKGGLNETLNKVILPFCNFLMRILQDHELFSCILKKKSTDLSNQIRWKLINWSLHLGEIVVQLARLSKYLSKDFQTIHVFMAFLCCKELAPYYDLIKDSIERQSIQLARVISQHDKTGLQVSLESERGAQLMNLKKSIEQMWKIKEKLNSIFGNRSLQNHLSLFTNPTKYKVFDQSFPNEIEQIIAYTAHKVTVWEQENTFDKRKEDLNSHCKNGPSIDEHETNDCPNQQEYDESCKFREIFMNVKVNIKQLQSQKIECKLNRKDGLQKIVNLRRDKRIQLVE